MNEKRLDLGLSSVPAVVLRSRMAENSAAANRFTATSGLVGD